MNDHDHSMTQEEAQYALMSTFQRAVDAYEVHSGKSATQIKVTKNAQGLLVRCYQALYGPEDVPPTEFNGLPVTLDEDPGFADIEVV